MKNKNLTSTVFDGAKWVEQMNNKSKGYRVVNYENYLL